MKIKSTLRSQSLTLAIVVALSSGLAQANTAVATTSKSPAAGVISRSSVQGTTPQQIHERFAAIIEHNFASGDAAGVVGRLTDKELANLSYLYTQAGEAGPAPLLKIFAKRLDAPALARVATAFGTAPVRDAVSRYASPEVAASYQQAAPTSDSGPAPASFVLGGQLVEESGPTLEAAPTVDMTPNEIYLEFRTAPVGSLSVEGALAETGIFVASRLVPAAALGTIIGTGINDVITTYDPDLSDAIGGTIDSALVNISDAADDFSQGQYEQGLDAVFGSWITGSGESSGYYGGDYDVSSSYDDFYNGY